MSTQRPEPVQFVGSGTKSNGTQAPDYLYLVGNLPAGSVAAATTSVAGVVKKAAAPGTQDFAGLYAALQAAGIIS